MRGARGFTMIELMIVALIVVILTLIALPNFSDWLQNSRTRSVAESLQNGMRFAQSESARLSRLTKIVTTGSSWNVRVVQVAGSLSAIDTQASDILQSSPAGNLDFVAISPNSPNNTVLEFNDLGRVSSSSTLTGTFNALSTDAVFTVSNSHGPRSLQIKVSPSGKVRMCDPDRTLSATDPNGC